MMEFIAADFNSATIKGDKVKLVFETSVTDPHIFEAIKHTSESVSLCIDPYQLNMTLDPETGEVRDAES